MNPKQIQQHFAKQNSGRDEQRESPFTTAVGTLATIVGASILVPQVLKEWTTKSIGDVSWGMAILYFANCVLWLWYGKRIRKGPVIVANAIGVVLGGLQIILKSKFG
jgi:MtN3 and saliva related transmembrane protein